MKYLLAGLLFLSISLAGCTGTPQKYSAESITGVSDAGNSAPVISEEEFNKIPKDLRPDDLENRDDTTVVIRAGDKRTIKEYRIGGFLYAIQVIPKIGPPYLLVAADNQGNFMRADKPGRLVPSWTIFEWD